MKVGILPCQGACNVGMMTNKVALHFVDNKTVNMVCPLGLPLGIENIIKMAAANDKHIALNGCSVKCSSKSLEAAGFNEYEELALTEDFKIEKNKNFHDETNMDKIKEEVEAIIARLAAQERD